MGFSVHEQWSRLRDIPCDPDGLLEEPFEDFPAGTDREEVWHWFEETYNIRIVDLQFPHLPGVRI